jgi:RES domain-containing protein
MNVFRIVPEAFSNKLNASGSANRWNLRGQKVIYTGSSRSLSTLELIVHRSVIQPSKPYKLLVISIDLLEAEYQKIQLDQLPNNWRNLQAYSQLQLIGSNWYKAQNSLLLEVPSAVIPQESNYIINTEHPDFSKKIRINRIEDYFWDNRLLSGT